MRLTIVGLVTLAASALTATSAGSPEEASRYPYDPVCEWGRIANGKGMLVRCITREEASAMLSSTAVAAPAPAQTTTPAPSASAPTEPAPTEEAAIVFRGISVSADEGKLPAAEKKLSTAKDKFTDCVSKNGGLEKNEGEVAVRFLVGDRGRAEGVSVQKRVSVGEKAAKCVADVVDRRWVGTPETPMVGATAVVKFSKVRK